MKEVSRRNDKGTFLQKLLFTAPPLPPLPLPISLLPHNTHIGFSPAGFLEATAPSVQRCTVDNRADVVCICLKAHESAG